MRAQSTEKANLELSRENQRLFSFVTKSNQIHNFLCNIVKNELRSVNFPDCGIMMNILT